MGTKSSLQIRPPREHGLGTAFGLAATLHAVLLALVIVGPRGPQFASAAGAVTSFQVAAAVPHMANQAWASTTAAPVRLSAANRRASDAQHRSHIAKVARLPGSVSRFARAGVAPRAPLADEMTIALPGNRPAQLEREARLAALQAVAGRPLPEGDVAAASRYAEMVARRVRANVVAPFDIDGNPSAVVAVRCTPSGALLSVTIERPSGNPRWDRAVVTAVENSSPMPADVSGSTPTSFVMTFRPKG
ncbi:energy transducer TonB [Paraburkholderia sp. JHI2823]|uniref:energy transducer TonB n=1 Tax=Paraburkholderia TaxID=1822464 RepID=UPI00316BDFCC